MKIIFATHNKGKLEEMKQLLSDMDIEVMSAVEAGIIDDIVEDGDTFADNAFIKARFVARTCNEWSVADDSGICISALGGEPGVKSARWAGEERVVNLADFTLEKMKDVSIENRQAYFESAIALVSPDGMEWVFSGRVNGVLLQEGRGTCKPGLPYDEIFVPESSNMTFAQMNDEQKNSSSHRGAAFLKLKEFLRNLIMSEKYEN